MITPKEVPYEILRGKLNCGEWVSPTLVNSWQSRDNDATRTTAGYRKGSNVVFLKGLMENGASGSVIFTLPEGFRPQRINTFICLASSSGAANDAAWIDIRANGEVYFVGVLSFAAAWNTSTGYVSLDGIWFFVD